MGELRYTNLGPGQIRQQQLTQAMYGSGAAMDQMFDSMANLVNPSAGNYIQNTYTPAPASGYGPTIENAAILRQQEAQMAEQPNFWKDLGKNVLQAGLTSGVQGLAQYGVNQLFPQSSLPQASGRAPTAEEKKLYELQAQMQQMQMDYIKTLQPAQQQAALAQFSQQAALDPYQLAQQQAQLGYGTEAAESAQSLLGPQTQLSQQQIGAQRQLLPGQTQLSGAQTGLAQQQVGLEQGMMPQRYGWEGAQLGAQQQLLPGQTQLSGAQNLAQQQLLPLQQQTMASQLGQQQNLLGGGGYGDLGNPYGFGQELNEGLGQTAQFLQNRGLYDSGMFTPLAINQAGRIAERAQGQARQEKMGMLQLAMGGGGFGQLN